MDVSNRTLQRAAARLKLDRLPEARREKIRLLHGSLTYRDARLAGFDAAAVVEVVEHLDPHRLAAFQRSLFGAAAPGTIVLTTRAVSTTSASPACPRERSATRTTASSGPGPSSRTGPPRSPRCTATRCASSRWARRTRRWGRPRRWRCSPGEALLPRAVARRPCRALGLRQVDVRGPALPADGGALVGLFPRPRGGRSERPGRDRGCVRRPALRRRAAPAGREAHRRRRDQRPARGPPAAGRDRAPPPRAARGDRVRPARGALPGAEPGAARPRLRPPRRAQPEPADAALDGHLSREGFRYVFVVRTPQEVDEAEIERTRLRSDLRDETGPFDLIGDVHGRYGELVELLGRLGYKEHETRGPDGEPLVAFVHPEGRKAVFVGDLVDRGPRSIDTVLAVRAMVLAGTGFCVPGNHDVRLVRKLRGRDVKLAHGLELTMAELESLSPEERTEVERKVAGFLDGLVAHLVLDGGRLVVAHAGMRQEMQGRASSAVRAFALWEPWSAKAQDLLRLQYAPVGAAARAGLAAAVATLEAASEHGIDTVGLLEAHRRRAELASRYTAAYRRYCWPVEGVGDLRRAVPFDCQRGPRPHRPAARLAHGPGGRARRRLPGFRQGPGGADGYP